MTKSLLREPDRLPALFPQPRDERAAPRCDRREGDPWLTQRVRCALRQPANSTYAIDEAKFVASWTHQELRQRENPPTSHRQFGFR